MKFQTVSAYLIRGSTKLIATLQLVVFISFQKIYKHCENALRARFLENRETIRESQRKARKFVILFDLMNPRTKHAQKGPKWNRISFRRKKVSISISATNRQVQFVVYSPDCMQYKHPSTGHPYFVLF